MLTVARHPFSGTPKMDRSGFPQKINFAIETVIENSIDVNTCSKSAFWHTDKGSFRISITNQFPEFNVPGGEALAHQLFFDGRLQNVFQGWSMNRFSPPLLLLSTAVPLGRTQAISSQGCEHFLVVEFGEGEAWSVVLQAM